MISVPSRRQPLNGSNILLLLFLPLALSLSACDLFTKVQPSNARKDKDKDVLDPIQGRRVFDPETGTYVVINTAPTAKMDTIIWKEVPMSTYPPITSTGVFFEPGNTGVSEPLATDPNTGSKFLESYNVVFALPFQTDRYSAGGQIPTNSYWALNFYSGAKIALDELKAEGIRLNVTVLDTKANEAGMSDLIRRNTDLANAHLIIGPYRRENVRLAAEFAKQKGSVLVSPYFSGENLTDNNPNYIQVNPSIQTHCESILENARKNYRPDQIVLVCRGRDVELERLKYFQDAHKRMQAASFSRDTTSLREFVIADEGDAGNFRINVQPLIQNKDTLAIIVPSWSSESFINALLQQLSTALAGYSEFTVYGMPQWIEYERIDYALYKNLRLHLTASHHVDREQWPVQDFQRNYFQRFGAIPAEESYLGYDATLYFCRMLKKYGTRFQYSLREDPGQGLHTRFEVKGLPVSGSANREIPLFRQFENKYLNMLQFQDFRFVKIN